MRMINSMIASTGDAPWNHMDGWGGGGMWLWGVAMMALFVVRAATGGANPSSPWPSRDPSERAREILAERYARGELTTEEYRERVEQLR